MSSRLVLAARAASWLLVLASLLLAPSAALGQPAAPASPTAPVPLYHPEPAYPASELSRPREATVVLKITVERDGTVSQPEVLESAGAAFDDAALAAVRAWTFTPAQREGKPLRVRIKAMCHFNPPTAPTAPPAPPRAPPGPPAPALPAAPPAAPPGKPDAGAPGSPAPSETPPTLEVQVRGRLEAREHGASDYKETVGELKAVPRTNASDVLKLAPGFLLTNEGGSGHAEQVFLRGFDAHEGQDLEFSVDGVPINDAGNYHGNGYADTHFIIPELIQSVRVLEGPYAPQQGDFAVAGSADYHLGLAQRGVTADYTIGSYGTQRALLLWGPSGGSDGTFAGAEFYTTNGFGTNRQAKRGTAIGQIEIPVGEKGVVRINATAYTTEYDSAGVVRLDDYQSGRVGFYGTEDPNQVGDTSTRASISATYENRFANNIDISQQLFVVYRSMHLLEDWTGFLNDVQEPTQEPHTQRGDMIDLHFNEVTVGGRGFGRWHGDVFGQRQELEAGYFARVDETTSTQYRDMAQPAFTPYLTDADLTSTIADIGVYVDADVRFTRWLQLRGGVRADTFVFDVTNNCAVNSQVGVDSPSNQNPQVDAPCLTQLKGGAYREPQQESSTGSGTVMPRGTLLVGPFGHFNLSLSAGTGVRSVDPSYVAQGLLTPFVSIQSGDVGVSYDNSIGPVDLAVKSVFFNTHSGQDQLFDPSEGRSTLASGSTRTGWSGSLRALGSFFDLSANATLVKATFDATPGGNGLSTASVATSSSTGGNVLVPYVPDLVLRADLALFHDFPWRLMGKPIRGTIGYGVSYVGRRPLPYSEFSDVIFISDASVSLAWSIWHVRFAGTNLFNAQYKLSEYNYASDFQSPASSGREPTLAPERSFTAGAPLQLMLTLGATFGGAS